MNDKNTKKKAMESDNNIRLGLLNSYQAQYKQLREGFVKAFRFYLLVIGIPFPILGGLLQIDVIRQSTVLNPAYFSMIPLFIFIVGILFFSINIRQGINSTQILKKLIAMQRILLIDNFPELIEKRYETIFPELHETDKEYPRSRLGADFF
jgi:hypothetical protein